MHAIVQKIKYAVLAYRQEYKVKLIGSKILTFSVKVSLTLVYLIL